MMAHNTAFSVASMGPVGLQDLLGDDNLVEWKMEVLLTLDHYELEKYIISSIAEPADTQAKSDWRLERDHIASYLRASLQQPSVRSILYNHGLSDN